MTSQLALNRVAAPGMRRRTWLGAVCALGLPAMTCAAGATLPSAESLREALSAALKDGSPLVVLVSLDGCNLCKLAREHYLGPMRLQNKLPVVQVNMHSSAMLQDFKGIALSHDQMVRAWQVRIAPSVLFFGAGGVELAPRLTGIGSVDYYGAHLDQRLHQARAAIKEEGKARGTVAELSAPPA